MTCKRFCSDHPEYISRYPPLRALLGIIHAHSSSIICTIAVDIELWFKSGETILSYILRIICRWSNTINEIPEGRSMNKNSIGITTTFVLMATTALSQTTKQDVIDELTEQGFKRIEITNTLFGNLRFEATGPGIEREVVLGKDGTIVRDRSERDDEFDDEEDDEEFDHEDSDDEEDDSEEDDEGDDS